MRPTVADDKRVGLAAPHPAAHKCAIVPFCSQNAFSETFLQNLNTILLNRGARARERKRQPDFFRYSAREMFHTKVQAEHYILWSAWPPYLQKILENLTFVPFLPLSPGFRRSWIGQNNDFGLFRCRWAKNRHLTREYTKQLQMALKSPVIDFCFCMGNFMFLL